MSTDITTYRNASLDEKRAYANTLAAAGELLPKGLWANVRNETTGLMENHPSAGKVLLLVETGLMLGLHPMAALQGIDVIEGHPTLKPALMTAIIRQAGFSLRISETGTVRGGDISCTVTLIRPDDPDFPYTSTWTPDDAILAGLVDSYTEGNDGVWTIRARDKNGEAKPWEKYTKRLLRWRAVGDVGSAGAEDVLMGMHYTPEELGAEIDQDGGLLQIPATASEPTEDWSTLISEATTKDALADIKKRAGSEWTDVLNTKLLTHYGMLNRGEIEAPAVDEPTDEPGEEDEPEHDEPEPEHDDAEPTPEEYAEMQAEAAQS